MSDLKQVEKFTVEAPVEWVWKLLLNAEQVVACLPGARLDGREPVGEEEEAIFTGALNFKVGLQSVELAGTATLSDVDYYEHSFKLTAITNDPGNGEANQSADPPAAAEDSTKIVISCKLVAIPAEGIEDPAEAEAAEECAASIEAEAELSSRLSRLDRVLLEEASQGILTQLVSAVRTRMADAKAALARESLRSELDALKDVLDEVEREQQAAASLASADPNAPQLLSSATEQSGKKSAAEKKRRSSEANMKLLAAEKPSSAELSSPVRALLKMRELLSVLTRQLSSRVKGLIDGPLRRLLRRSG